MTSTPENADSSSSALTATPLAGPWSVRKKGDKESLAAEVPGCIHRDLRRAGLIPDPAYRDNASQLRWVEQSEWTYTLPFTLPWAIQSREFAVLRFLGLDTRATVTLNDHLLGKADNMFRSWEFDVGNLLVHGDNRLVVAFAPLSSAARRPPVGGDLVAREGGDRKQSSQFGSSFSPRLPTVGIWRPVELLGFDAARLADIHIRQDHASGPGVKLSVEVRAEIRQPQRYRAAVTVFRNGAQVGAGRCVLRRDTGRATLILPGPELWWPNGMGAQPLYDVCVDLADDSGNILDRRTHRIGLRTLDLERAPDTSGEGFRFVVNGAPFFAKGANWVPAYPWPSCVTREDYARLLGDAKAVHMNMLRVWGGGVYEDDAFYTLCDELGLCVWQDFMLAGGAHPAHDSASIENVDAEAREQVRRLRHHPCLALWCGNSEFESGFADPAGDGPAMPPREYHNLFDKRLPDIVRTLDGQTAYWPSSPHSPKGPRRGIGAGDPDRGDAHAWGARREPLPPEAYLAQRHRFFSEFGCPSWPAPKTVEGFTDPADRQVNSYAMAEHDNSGPDTVCQLLDWFRAPARFDMALWTSQIFQSATVQTAVEHMRRSTPRTMGALYWHLNASWPAASGSSIDSAGRWKAVHYAARRFFAPLLLSAVPRPAEGTMDIHLSSDSSRFTRGIVRAVLMDLGGATLMEETTKVCMEPRSSARVAQTDITAIVDRHGQAQWPGSRQHLAWLEFLVDDQPVAATCVLFAKPRFLELSDPRLACSVTGSHTDYQVTVSADRPALWVWLDTGEAEATFSDNFFHLMPGMEKEIDVRLDVPLDPAQFRQQLRTCSLFDTYR